MLAGPLGKVILLVPVSTVDATFMTCASKPDFSWAWLSFGVTVTSISFVVLMSPAVAVTVILTVLGSPMAGLVTTPVLLMRLGLLLSQVYVTGVEKVLLVSGKLS